MQKGDDFDDDDEKDVNGDNKLKIIFEIIILQYPPSYKVLKTNSNRWIEKLLLNHIYYGNFK